MDVGRAEQVFEVPRANVLRDEVTLAIERAILLGLVTPGQRLIEAEIARQMGISKAPVREALRTLQQLGLVECRPRHGTFVTSLTSRLAREAFSLRTLLECFAVRLAVNAVDDEYLDRMVAMDRVADSHIGDHGVMIEYDLRTHDLVFEASGHHLLQAAWVNLRSQTKLLLTVSGVLRYGGGSAQGGGTVSAAHAPIIAALRARDAASAEAAVSAHLAEGERRLLAKLVPQELSSAGASETITTRPGGVRRASR